MCYMLYIVLQESKQSKPLKASGIFWVSIDVTMLLLLGGGFLYTGILELDTSDWDAAGLSFLGGHSTKGSIRYHQMCSKVTISSQEDDWQLCSGIELGSAMWNSGELIHIDSMKKTPAPYFFQGEISEISMDFDSHSGHFEGFPMRLDSSVYWLGSSSWGPTFSQSHMLLCNLYPYMRIHIYYIVHIVHICRICICVYIYICIYIYTYTYIYIYIHTYTCMYICLYIYNYTMFWPWHTCPRCGYTMIQSLECLVPGFSSPRLVTSWGLVPMTKVKRRQPAETTKTGATGRIFTGNHGDFPIFSLLKYGVFFFRFHNFSPGEPIQWQSSLAAGTQPLISWNPPRKSSRVLALWVDLILHSGTGKEVLVLLLRTCPILDDRSNIHPGSIQGWWKIPWSVAFPHNCRCFWWKDKNIGSINSICFPTRWDTPVFLVGSMNPINIH